MKYLIRSLYEHRWLLGIVILYAATAKLLGLWLGLPVQLTLYDPASGQFAYIVPVIYALGRACFVALILRPDRPLAQLWREWLSWVSVERIVGLLICLLVLPPFLSVFTSLKSAIPVLEPFAWDDAFFHLDRAIHGGRDPWQILQPLLGDAAMTSIVADAYHAWYFIVYATVMVVAWSGRDRQVRIQFLITFTLSWILLGNIAATLLSSAGPCYFGRVTGLADPYQALMAYLDSVGAISRVPQEALWAIYQGGHGLFRNGLSAMPSMHVAMVTLIALFGWRTSRLAGVLATLYAGVVMIGSVHLGWHYAVDGYVAAAGTVAIWQFVGWCLCRDAAPAAEPLAIATRAFAGAAPDDGRGAALEAAPGERSVRELS